MRKSLIQVAAALAVTAAGSAHAGLTIDLNGGAAGGVINATALDWAPTTILAKGGGLAIDGFRAGVATGGQQGCGVGTLPPCLFTVMTHSKLIGYNDATTGQYVGLNDSFGEITFVTSFEERITGDFGGVGASYRTVGTGRLEIYFSETANSNPLSGSGFNDGTLIGWFEGTRGLNTSTASGSFELSLDDNNRPIVSSLDGTSDGNQYFGPSGDQLTLEGAGSHQVIRFGSAGFDLNNAFFKTLLSDFSIRFENLSLSVPFGTSNPSDCFNAVRGTAVIGDPQFGSECNATHVNGRYADQSNADPGYLPVVGDLNFGPGSAPDFVVQSDPNSPVTGTIPEPTSIALIGLALAAAGTTARRRRK